MERSLKPPGGMVTRGGVCLAHLCVTVVVLVRLQLGLTVRGVFYFLLPCELWRSVYSETSFFSPCCRRVSELVVMARGVLQRRGVEDSRLWLLRGGAATSLSTKCSLLGVSSSSVDQSTVRHIPVPRSSVTSYSEDDMGIPGIRGNEENLTSPWSSSKVENIYVVPKIIKSELAECAGLVGGRS
ncbi:hypothetical protein IGI04_010053 [Brassica rapa subsp. trilocularis]|uniref:Uncharacterized protein n=1 Tax=Brassica rapa subsp. trilocularis TaxID=1813537 RepID=A0ABQ7N2F0_BRACM|nr:hypothetical protein IGI04_010053 [Brassica rapa subsp. trilocularis]